MNRRVFGFSLVELMVALALSLLLGAGILQIFLSSKVNYRLQDALGWVQETGRFATSYMARDIRMAGQMGCPDIRRLKGKIHIIANDPPADITDFLNYRAVIGYEGTGSGWDPTPPFNTDELVPGTDILTIYRAEPCGAYLTGNMDADNANIQVIKSELCTFQQNEVLMVTDCQTADIFRATSVSQSTGGFKITIAHAQNANTDNRLSKAYQSDAQVLEPTAHTYYIGYNPAGRPALYLRTPEATYELAEGVENMQVLYGFDNGNRTVDTYLTANNITDWDRVIGVRIALLVSSPEQARTETDTKTYNLLGTTVDPPEDRRVRRVFNLTIALRNQVL